ncbi:flavodoxin family protein [Megalodesulfovibrio gigas]|uniref:Putative NADPH-dependent FMN reductase n=1 Tax=Megalodesulfovibrio gigas (strain ATCC 19364 / DSM 1382 / NCIMB 9332 / VKM B-1759) TaxID=1121448 RepID=T2GDR8_MEGG1|nr:flavodoxin family protein [Megalodesulfovibrio gigas]AGW14448.1 putative NADPH-dependent FMN reductase [Megalodesulfovibrio gigas DSM 1382 = ATCC 19364]
MKAIAINGSPRKNWNTATLLQHALDGAREAGAQTEIVHLYDLSFTGCVSCFACKKIDGKHYGHCAVKDDLAPVLQAVAEADVLLMGTPVYFGSETGEMRSCLERLLFPYLTYTPDYECIFPGRLQAGMIYTMNITEDMIPEFQYEQLLSRVRGYVARVFGNCELQICTDTLQFSDYAKYLSTRWDAVAKAARREEVFPQDCAKARALGAALTERAAATADR